MQNPGADEPTADKAVAVRSATAKKAKRKKSVNPAKHTRARKAAKRVPQGKTESKKAQLIGLLSNPHGARISMLVERLSWQGHTIRAALSRLRKQGHEITTSKSAKGDEAVYAIVGALAAGKAKYGKASA
jgi:hypothetical protein